MDLLTSLGNRWGTDRGSKHGCAHGYTRIYNEYFQTRREEITSVFEIGTHFGAGLKMWQDYFPNANIYGIESLPPDRLLGGVKPIYDETDVRIKSFVANQTSHTDLQFVMGEIDDTFDLIIDDGDHRSKNHQISLANLFPFLRPGGIYIIEDLFTVASQDTLRMITTFEQTGKIISDYISSETSKYIESQIKFQKTYRGYWRGNSSNPVGNDVIKLWVIEKK
jgi:hypothetical protein|tara:strand:+ start:3488 stop:4153 length:666 start_codon:yes stop_codon:yes gene_type:complete